jgi:hypothetical protein
MTFRDAWVDGRTVRTGYCCDLRLTPKMRGGGKLSRGWRAALDWARDEMGVELFHDVVFDSNARARSALEKRGPKRPDAPIHRVVCPFDMTSIQFTKKSVPSSPRARRAHAGDFEEIVALLRRDQASRTLGYVIDAALLESRFASWPGLSIESFIVLRDAQGKLLGCVAPYDTSSFKRTRVLGYHGAMRAFRTGYDAVARLRGFRRLPLPGECFDFSFLTHLALDHDDPELLRELLLAAYAELAPRDQHFMSVFVPQRSPMRRAFRGFFVNRTPMTLYSVHRAASEWSARDLASSRAGFEMALS